MNAEDTEAMQALDNRLRKMFAGLDADAGFEQRLQARVTTLAARSPAEALARIEREHDRARTAADRAARVDALAIAIGGIGSLVAVWRLAPSIAHLYSTSLETASPALISVATLAASGAALWALLRQCDVDLRRLVGV
jgi:hypothetical protein